jgi:hypothetical protein
VDQAIGSATLAKAIAAGNYKTLQKEGNGVAANGAGLGHYADFRSRVGALRRLLPIRALGYQPVEFGFYRLGGLYVRAKHFLH